MGTAEPWQDSTSAGGTTYDTGRDDTNAPPDRSLLGPLTQGDMRMVPLAGLVEHFGHVQVVALPDPAQATAGDPLAALPALDAAICADQIASDTDTTNLRQGRLRVVLRDDVARDALRARTLRNFWRRSAGLLRRYNGIPRQHLFLFLKECEWRFSDGSHEANLATLRAWFTPLH
jgi:transposase